MKKTIFAGKSKSDKKVYTKRVGNYNVEKHKSEYRQKRRKKNYLLRFIIFVVVVGGIIFLLNTSLFDVKDIVVEGNSYYASDEIINISNGEKGKNILWGSHKGDMEKRLNDDAYIESAKVKMKFPSTIVISVKERVQIAYIKYADNYVVIDKEGVVLRKTKTVPKLTKISGLTVCKVEEKKPIEVEETRILEKNLKTLDAMSNSNLYFIKLKITNGTTYAYVYDKMICKGAVKDIIESIENGNLEKILYKFTKKGTKRGTISIGSNNYASYSPI